MKMLFWTIPAAIAVAAIAYSIALYNIEEARQTGSMMKACVDAGGDWQKDWRGQPSCMRPRQEAQSR